METRYCRTPPMPWGIDRNQLAPTFSRWNGQPVKMHNVTFLFPCGPLRWLIPLLEKPRWVTKCRGCAAAWRRGSLKRKGAEAAPRQQVRKAALETEIGLPVRDVVRFGPRQMTGSMGNSGH